LFVEGMVQQKGLWLLYYGAADKYIGVAEAPAKMNVLSWASAFCAPAGSTE
jgi:predicted GH43/DUF377 family glycosyl hydrolase